MCEVCSEIIEIMLFSLRNKQRNKFAYVLKYSFIHLYAIFRDIDHSQWAFEIKYVRHELIIPATLSWHYVEVTTLNDSVLKHTHYDFFFYQFLSEYTDPNRFAKHIMRVLSAYPALFNALSFIILHAPFEQKWTYVTGKRSYLSVLHSIRLCMDERII